jgi:hypothetical protein
MTTGSSMVATTRIRRPHRGQANTSSANLWRRRSAHDHVRGPAAAGGPPWTWRVSGPDHRPDWWTAARSGALLPSRRDRVAARRSPPARRQTLACAAGRRVCRAERERGQER